MLGIDGGADGHAVGRPDGGSVGIESLGEHVVIDAAFIRPAKIGAPEAIGDDASATLDTVQRADRDPRTPRQPDGVSIGIQTLGADVDIGIVVVGPADDGAVAAIADGLGIELIVIGQDHRDAVRIPEQPAGGVHPLGVKIGVYIVAVVVPEDDSAVVPGRHNGRVVLHVDQGDDRRFPDTRPVGAQAAGVDVVPPLVDHGVVAQVGPGEDGAPSAVAAHGGCVLRGLRRHHGCAVGGPDRAAGPVESLRVDVRAVGHEVAQVLPHQDGAPGAVGNDLQRLLIPRRGADRNTVGRPEAVAVGVQPLRVDILVAVPVVEPGDVYTTRAVLGDDRVSLFGVVIADGDTVQCPERMAQTVIPHRVDIGVVDCSSIVPDEKDTARLVGHDILVELGPPIVGNRSAVRLPAVHHRGRTGQDQHGEQEYTQKTRCENRARIHDRNPP